MTKYVTISLKFNPSNSILLFNAASKTNSPVSSAAKDGYNEQTSEPIITISLLRKKINYFFLKLDCFLSTYCKKCIFTIENSK